MGNSIRTFIAVDINPVIRSTIGQLQENLRQCDCNVKWVQPENIHLTLKFLGDVKLKKIDEVNQTLTDLYSNIEPFETEISQLGAFPTVNRPRIFWVGLKDDRHQISHLVTSLESTLGKIGFKKESKPFSPHITIGRIRSPRNLNALTQILSEYELPKKLTQEIREVVFYKSTLTSTGPVYEKLNTFCLGSS